MSDTKAILIDVTRCVGCEDCIAACKVENHLGPDRPWRGQGRIDDLSSTRFSTILHRPSGHFVRQMCRHCLEPACASACLVGALQKTPQGAVVYDAGLCMGCRYCMNACPYGIPRYEWDARAPRIRKCIFCIQRLEKNEAPACVGACKYGAMHFGTRQEMLAKGHEIIAANKEKTTSDSASGESRSSRPSRGEGRARAAYIQQVYGESEVGGTNVLYVSDIPLDFLSWKSDLGTEPLPDLTWNALKKVPGVVVGMGGLMTGLYWVIGRRNRIAAEEAAAAAAAAQEKAQEKEGEAE